ncbi:MAG: glycosyltransferase family 8 protein [Roseinatronobacter sp.]
MHIVTASDRNYIPGVLVLIASAARHNPGARFTVLAVDWQEADFTRLAALAQHLDVPITPLPLGSDRLDGLSVTRRHLTTTTYARLLLPELLPDAARVLYMDCDMVVTGSLDGAWTCDLGDHLVAAVPCPGPNPDVLRLLGLQTGAYVNGGFLLLNLALWRAEKIAETCLDALIRTPEKFPTQDEAALNHFCAGRILYLPAIYNIYATQFLYPEQLCPPEEIRVLHFIVGKKPWVRKSTFSPVWYAEAARVAPVTGLPAIPLKGGLRDWLRHANQDRKIWQARLSPGAGRARYLRQYQPYRKWVESFDTQP